MYLTDIKRKLINVGWEYYEYFDLHNNCIGKYFYKKDVGHIIFDLCGNLKIELNSFDIETQKILDELNLNSTFKNE